MARRTLNKLQVCAFALVSTFGFLVSEAQAKTFVFEQGEIAIPLVLAHPNGQISSHRLRIAPLTETICLGSNRQIILAANEDVPAYLESSSSAQRMRLVFQRVSAQAQVSGRALFRRQLLLLDDTGLLRAEFLVTMELDLLGLGDEEAKVKLRQAELVEVQGHGDWQGIELERSVFLALPAAPLSWAMSGAHLGFSARSNRLFGEWKFGAPLSPEAFLDGDTAQVAVTVYRKESEAPQHLQIEVRAYTEADGQQVWRQVERKALLHSFEVKWQETSDAYIGIITGDFGLGFASQIARISVRFGSEQSPFNTQIIGLIAQR